MLGLLRLVAEVIRSSIKRSRLISSRPILAVSWEKGVVMKESYITDQHASKL